MSNIVTTLNAFGERYSPAMKITEQAEADAWLEKLVDSVLVKFPHITRDYASLIERTNIAYFAGYFDDDTRERVERLFRCAHPVFGPIAVNGPPSPQTAFELGRAAGKASLGERSEP